MKSNKDIKQEFNEIENNPKINEHNVTNPIEFNKINKVESNATTKEETNSFVRDEKNIEVKHIEEQKEIKVKEQNKKDIATKSTNIAKVATSVTVVAGAVLVGSSVVSTIRPEEAKFVNVENYENYISMEIDVKKWSEQLQIRVTEDGNVTYIPVDEPYEEEYFDQNQEGIPEEYLEERSHQWYSYQILDVTKEQDILLEIVGSLFMMQDVIDSYTIKVEKQEPRARADIMEANFSNGLIEFRINVWEYLSDMQIVLKADGEILQSRMLDRPEESGGEFAPVIGSFDNVSSSGTLTLEILSKNEVISSYDIYVPQIKEYGASIIEANFSDDILSYQIEVSNFEDFKLEIVGPENTISVALVNNDSNIINDEYDLSDYVFLEFITINVLDKDNNVLDSKTIYLNRQISELYFIDNELIYHIETPEPNYSYKLQFEYDGSILTTKEIKDEYDLLSSIDITEYGIENGFITANLYDADGSLIDTKEVEYLHNQIEVNIESMYIDNNIFHYELKISNYEANVYLAIYQGGSLVSGAEYIVPAPDEYNVSSGAYELSGLSMETGEITVKIYKDIENILAERVLEYTAPSLSEASIDSLYFDGSDLHFSIIATEDDLPLQMEIKCLDETKQILEFASTDALLGSVDVTTFLTESATLTVILSDGNGTVLDEREIEYEAEMVINDFIASFYGYDFNYEMNIANPKEGLQIGIFNSSMDMMYDSYEVEFIDSLGNAKGSHDIKNLNLEAGSYAVGIFVTTEEIYHHEEIEYIGLVIDSGVTLNDVYFEGYDLRYLIVTPEDSFNYSLKITNNGNELVTLEVSSEEQLNAAFNVKNLDLEVNSMCTLTLINSEGGVLDFAELSFPSPTIIDNLNASVDGEILYYEMVITNYESSLNAALYKDDVLIADSIQSVPEPDQDGFATGEIDLAALKLEAGLYTLYIYIETDYILGSQDFEFGGLIPGEESAIINNLVVNAGVLDYELEVTEYNSNFMITVYQDSNEIVSVAVADPGGTNLSSGSIDLSAYGLHNGTIVVDITGTDSVLLAELEVEYEN